MKPLLMGIVNCTPDSFSDGGLYYTPSSAVDHALRLLDDGASFLDVGGESTRPGSYGVSSQEELQRVIPVIKGIRSQNTSTPISIDTSKADVAEQALDAGATMINDVTAGTGDERMFAVAVERNVPIILMHMQGTPRTMQDNTRYDDVVGEVKSYLQERVIRVKETSVESHSSYNQQIYVDPGIGFSKTPSQCLTLLHALDEFAAVGPVLVGISRKSFLGKISGIEHAAERDSVTAALHAILLTKPITIARVHNVALIARVLQIL
ncbi:MAG: dihydropteroate synthase [Ignavibacteria bacterium]|nr:dihydropteroate synthase [Ignavibacteria bacterium]